MPASAWRSRPGSERPVLPRPSGSGGAASARETTAEWGGRGQPPPSPGPRPPPSAASRGRCDLQRSWFILMYIYWRSSQQETGV
nr:translation initiation factor IF-2-like [Pongo pygmaeus]